MHVSVFAYLFFRQPSTIVLNGDLVLVSIGCIFGCDVEYTVGIEIECHFDLGDTTRGGGETLQ